MNPDTILIELLLLLAGVVNSGHVLGEKKDLKAINESATFSNQHSHEELHSKNESNSLGHDSKHVNAIDSKYSGEPTAINHVNNSVSNKLLSKTDMYKNSTVMAGSLPPPHETSIISEGGVEIMRSTKDPLGINSNETKQLNNTTITSTPKTTHVPLSITETIDSTTKQSAKSTMDKPVHKRIHGRPGVVELEVPLVSSSLNSTSSGMTTTELPQIKKKKKPLFTMIKDDKESKESESFIESSTTGRDYVLPIVLTILSLPVVVYLIKVIYRRGTEFTERQQYHRMYLIDGMYNSR